MRTIQDRKEYFRKHYLEKIKPFRKKRPATAYHLFPCPVCGKSSFMRNFEKQISVNKIRWITFGGRGGIKITDCAQKDNALVYAQFRIILIKQILRVAGLLGLELVGKKERIRERVFFREHLPFKDHIKLKEVIPWRKNV